MTDAMFFDHSPHVKTKVLLFQWKRNSLKLYRKSILQI